jgi:hypothetical protein
MNEIKLPLTILLFICSSAAYCQQNKYDMSSPVEIQQNTGWNKVLCMKNGNTMLFHFEPRKDILVKVFDSLHKEVASRNDPCRFLDVSKLESGVYKGLYEINGEAVLFMAQEYNGKNQLVRLQYSSLTGLKTNEEVVKESYGENRRIDFYVMENKNEDNYAILFFMDVLRSYKENEISVACYNSKHEAIKETKLEIDRKNFDYCDAVSGEFQKEGLLVTLCLAKTIVNGATGRYTPYNQNSGVYDNYLEFFFIPKGGTVPMRNLIKISQDVFPAYAFYTYNPFANTVNFTMYSYRPYNFGINKIGYNASTTFFKLDEQERKVGFNRINNTFSNNYLKQHSDTNSKFNGLPQKIFTNEYGLTTLFNSSYTQYGEPETRAKYNFQDYIGNIGITQLDDNGNEIWGTVLPLAQYFKSYKQFYHQIERPTWWQDHIIFGDMPEQVYGRQFVYFNTYTKSRDFYIVYNDLDKNFNNSIGHPGDTVYDFSSTNACYYKIDRKNNVTKKYLFGPPVDNDYKSSFIESADFDEQRGTYATLVQYKRNDGISLRMAWAKLD